MSPTSDGYIRLYRVDNTHRQRYRPVEGLSGRWFSDDPAYIDEHYAYYDTQWTYVDVPVEVAEQFRYENVAKSDAGRNLYGVEGKDFVLPPEWADKRIPISRPDEHIANCGPKSFIVTEITSNVAQIGKVIHYDPESGDLVVVAEVWDDDAVLLWKNSKKSKESYRKTTVPIRKVTRM